MGYGEMEPITERGRLHYRHFETSRIHRRCKENDIESGLMWAGLKRQDNTAQYHTRFRGTTKSDTQHISHTVTERKSEMWMSRGYWLI